MANSPPPADISPAPDMTLGEMRMPLVEAMLPHVPFDGWTAKAAAMAAADMGLAPGVARLVFPGGAIDMVDALSALMDSRMQDALSGRDFLALKVRDRVTQAIRTRLAWATPHREALRRATAVLALPGNARRAAGLAWRSADAIWRLAGDRSTDFNHYSKRALATAVLSSTGLFWLNDDSEGQHETWAFLDRRIAGVMQIEKAKARLRGVGGERPSLLRFLGRLRYPVEGGQAGG